MEFLIKSEYISQFNSNIAFRGPQHPLFEEIKIVTTDNNPPNNSNINLSASYIKFNGVTKSLQYVNLAQNGAGFEINSSNELVVKPLFGSDWTLFTTAASEPSTSSNTGDFSFYVQHYNWSQGIKLTAYNGIAYGASEIYIPAPRSAYDQQYQPNNPYVGSGILATGPVPVTNPVFLTPTWFIDQNNIPASSPSGTELFQVFVDDLADGSFQMVYNPSVYPDNQYFTINMMTGVVMVPAEVTLTAGLKTVAIVAMKGDGSGAQTEQSYQFTVVSGSGGGSGSGGEGSGGGSGGGGGGSTSPVSNAVVVGGKAVGTVSVDPRTTAVRVTIAGVEQALPTGSVVRLSSSGQKFLKVSGGELEFAAISVTPPVAWSWSVGGTEAWSVLQSF